MSTIFGNLVALILILLPHGLVEDDGEDDQDVTHEGDQNYQHNAEHLQSEMELHLNMHFLFSQLSIQIMNPSEEQPFILEQYFSVSIFQGG